MAKPHWEEVFGRVPKLLIADDQELNRELLKDLLAPEGYQIVEAENGEQALEVFEQERPDLVLLDVVMPLLDGFEVCQRLKGDPQGRLVPVVMLTALEDSASRIRGIESGADDFISKPPNPLELLPRIKFLTRTRFLNEDLEHTENVIYSLAKTLEFKDHYTEGHSQRVAFHARRVGKALGLTPHQLEVIYKGSLLHDIGKIGSPADILNKTSKLGKEEFELLAQHPVIGVEICQPVRSFRNLLHVIRSHHEKLDGSGYPDGLRGEQILLDVRIVTVADVYDSLASLRPYRSAFSREQALKIMKEEVEKAWWDARVFEAFTDHIASLEKASGGYR